MDLTNTYLAAPPDDRPEPCGPTKSTPRILLAEDDDDLRAFLTSVFELAGYCVRSFPSGAGLLDALSGFAGGQEDGHRSEASVIVTDVRMPWFDGLSIVERFRAVGHSLPVIVISACTDERTLRRARQVGNSLFLPKPIDCQQLLEAVTALTTTAPMPRREFRDPQGASSRWTST